MPIWLKVDNPTTKLSSTYSYFLNRFLTFVIYIITKETVAYCTFTARDYTKHVTEAC